MSIKPLVLSLAALIATGCLATPAMAGDVVTTTTTTTPATQQWVPGHFEYDAWGNGTYVAGHWIIIPGTSQTVVTHTTVADPAPAPAPVQVVAQPAPAPQVVYEAAPQPAPQVVYVQQQPQVVYVQEPVCAPVYAPACPPPGNHFSIAIGVGGGYGYHDGYRDHDHGGGWHGPFLPIPVPVPLPLPFFHHR
jgi:hypothetical protein